MYLLILETIGTQELILVGIVALIVFGPRKLPEMARKAGSLMREFRTVSNDFKSTWAEEVRSVEQSETGTIPNKTDISNKILAENGSDSGSNVGSNSKPDENIMPQVREVSEEDFKKLVESKKKLEQQKDSETDKENWL